MKNKRLAKANKAQKSAQKIAAKKAAAENSAEDFKDINSNKKRKQSKLDQKQTDMKMVENMEKNKKLNKQAKHETNVKAHIQTSTKNKPDKGKKGASKNTAAVKPIIQHSYEEAPVHDVQRYLETLPSAEIRNFIEGLIAQDKFNMLTIDVVAAVGDLERMKYYFQKDATTGKSRYDPNGRCLDGGTPLHTAIKAKNKESVQLLIENGADLSLVDFMGDNAIMAAIKAGVANMINLLWPYKADLDVNHKNTVGKTALHLATERSWEGCVRFLLSNHAIPDVKDREGITPLMLAADKGDLKIVEILVKAGADICLEDEDNDSSICRALFNEHQQVVDFMLNSIDARRRDVFIKDLIYNVMNPPLPDGEYMMAETQFLPVLEECTKHSGFRNSFLNQKVVQMIMVKMTKKVKHPDSVTQICCLLMCIFFRFGNEIDTQFVRQFVQSKGTDLVISLVQMYMCEWGFSTKDALQIFLPMIGLVEIPEGRVWLHKNVLDVSEFFNHFEKDHLDVFFIRNDKYEWCSDKKHFKEINRVWIHFYNEVNRMQTEQREKHMVELLQQEEREKDRKEKRLEKIKQKRKEKVRRLESSATTELLESWSVKSILEEEDDGDEDESFDEDTVGTCRNANAIASVPDEHQKAVAQSMGNMECPIKVSAQPDSQSSTKTFNWTNSNGEMIVEQFQKASDEDWTKVQTKKNKEKEKQTNEKQKIGKRLPFQNLKGMKPTNQKLKKKKDTKTKTVPLNAFAKPSTTSSHVGVRWADIAKGTSSKVPPNIEADDKSFPKPKANIAVNKSNGYQKQTQEIAEKEFPCLHSNTKATGKKGKPNKMTFHFHSTQSSAADYESEQHEVEEDSIDIEEAEKELQELEEQDNSMTVTDSGKVPDRNALTLQSSECFMYDPEYTDESRPNYFDPTKLTDEEINSLNSRGKLHEEESRQTKRFATNNADLSDESQDEHESKVSKENVTNKDDWMKHVRDSEEDPENKNLVNMRSCIQGEMHLTDYRSNTIIGKLRPINGVVEIADKEKTAQQVESKQINQTAAKTSGVSKICTKKKKEKKSHVVVSVANMHDQVSEELKDQHDNVLLSRTSPVKIVLTDAETQLLRNQTETFDNFEEQLELHDSEHFMDLIVSVSPIFEPEPNIIDDMFSNPAEIPEWLEDEEEIPKEEDVWQEMTTHSTPIKQIDENQKEQSSKNCQVSVETTSDAERKTHTVQIPVSPCDLLSADPAIIHCSKRPEYIENINVDIASKMKKEYEASVFGRQQLTTVPPSTNQSQMPSNLHEQTDISIKEISADREEKEPALNPIGAEKQTAVIKPLGLSLSSPVPATNCAFGQKLLENACRLEDTNDSDNGILYPSDLAGETYEPDGQQTRHEAEDEPFYFPSFHEDTMLSAHFNKEDVSVSHRIQQLQLKQLHNYYSRCKDRIADATSMEQPNFVYYAQSAGMNKDRIQQHIQGEVEVDKRNIPKEQNPRPDLPERKESTIKESESSKQTQESNGNKHPISANPGEMQTPPRCQNSELPPPDVHRVPANGKFKGNMTDENIPQDGIQRPVPVMPLLQFGVLVPFPAQPMHPANVRNIQTQQAAMTSCVRHKIQDILQSMFKAKVKSVRWRNELSKIRNLPPEKLKVIGKIMIPRDDCDIVCIGYHCSGITILGYLSDGSEVAVKIMDTNFRPLKEDEIDKLLSVDSSQIFINRYRAIEEFCGHYYLAMDLYEYSLPEYMKILSHDKRIDLKIATEKLVFQLLRAILTMHQHYLIVHGELRPENVVIDVDGNLKVIGYGIGRNTIRDTGRYAEYSDEDKCWLAPEVLLYNQTIVFKTDIWSVGMLIYYIYKGGKNAFGSEPLEIIQNIGDQKHMMEYISDEAGHLLGMMLSVNKIDRPAIADALKHPMFWAEEKKLRFISIVGSDVVWEMKNNLLAEKKQRDNSMTGIVSMAPCNINLIRWMQAIEPPVMKEMKNFRQYKNSIVELVVFVYNCCNHFETLSKKVKEIIDEPCKYFLRKFPTLFMTVYRVIKFSPKKDKTCYKPFF